VSKLGVCHSSMKRVRSSAAWLHSAAQCTAHRGAQQTYKLAFAKGGKLGDVQCVDA